MATVILKRLADAEKDGDPVYAVIKAVGTSSDGRGKGLTVPKPEGQVTALNRAYEKAGIPPETVGLLEAHGTSTVAGDRSEAAALHSFFSGIPMPPRSCGVGSVKSQIGHAKCAAGIASLVKTVLALHHKVLPPTAGVESPLSDLAGRNNPLYLNTTARPWFAAPDQPRRAGVSAFGFGGTNFHAVLEEYTGPAEKTSAGSPRPDWESELFVFQGPDSGTVQQALQALAKRLDQTPEPPLKDLAYTQALAMPADNAVRLAVVAVAVKDLREKLAIAGDLLAKEEAEGSHPAGIYFSRRPAADRGKLAFVYPGQGSQYTGMLTELALAFPRVREVLERFDRHLSPVFCDGLTRLIYPPPAWSAEEKEADETALKETNVTQASMGAVDTAMHELLTSLGAVPDMTAGHSYGEYPALFAAGVMAEADLARLSEARGRFIIEAAGAEPGTMAAVRAAEAEVAPLLENRDQVWIANLNSPQQTVISGSEAGVSAALEILAQQGIRGKAIPVACAFHSPIVNGARSRLADLLEKMALRSPDRPVYSNTTAACFADDPAEIRQLLARQLVSPVRFTEEVRAMYAAGARIFVEVGANAVLTGLIKTILADKPHQALATDKKGRSGLDQLQHTLAKLAAAGVALNLERLYDGRGCRRLEPDAIIGEEPPLSRTAFIIGHGTVRPADQPPPVTVVPRPICFADEAGQAATGIIENPVKIPTDNNHTEEWNRNAMSSLPPPPEESAHLDTGREPFPPGDRVIDRFQDLMGQFLETQKTVMTAWLNRSAAAAADVRPEDFRMPEAPFRATGFPPEPAAAVQSADAPVPPDIPAASAGQMETGSAATAAAANGSGIDVKTILLETVSDCTGYPVEMLELDQEIEAELGIDSIKRMQAMEELEAALEKHHIRLPENRQERLVESQTLADLLSGLEAVIAEAGTTPAAATAPGPAPAASADASADGKAPLPLDISATLMAVVSDLSGYPADMLEPDQEIDADLGIDSIKRMEILTHFESKLDGLGIRLTDADREHLAESVTLNDIVVRLQAIIADHADTGEVSPDTVPADDPAAAKPNADEDDIPSSAETKVAAGPAEPSAVAWNNFRNSLGPIVEEHTGYPAEILEADILLAADLEMEAGLVETVVDQWIDRLEPEQPGLRDAVAGSRPEQPACLGDLTDWMATILASLPEESRSSLPQPREMPAPIRRYTLYAKKRDLITSPEKFLGEANVLVTRIPGDPLAQAVIARLEELNRKVLILEQDLPATELPGTGSGAAVYCADFADFDQLAGTVDDIRETHGPVAALLHLVPLAAGGTFPFADLSDWKRETAVMIKSLFCLTKLLAADLAAAASDGAAGIVAATAMGGTFASITEENEKDREPDFSPLGGGICGFLKALAEEMSGLNIRVVDNDPGDAPAAIAEQVVSELLTPSADIEVGYQDGCRLVLDILEEPLGAGNQQKISINAGSRLLITGGARGITAAVTLELARRFKPTLLLVGRTPLAEEESPLTAGIEDEKQLKAVLAEEMKFKTEKVRPADLEKACRQIRAQREIRETLRKIRKTGAEACYLQGDVTDAAGFTRLIAGVYEKYGRIDGVIHGAGYIEDKAVRDKDIRSFDRVFDTKADSLFVLSQALQADTLRFLALFSSVAGRYGNAGQSDYGAANEVYNKTALYLNRIWPGRVVSYIWGPWENRGMVSDALREKFNAGGISLIPRQEGVNHFIDELLYGPPHTTEVIYGGWDDRKKALTADRRTAGLPLLSGNANFYPSRNGNVELIRRLDADYDHYLRDHVLDGQPVLPMAMAMEMMAEAVAYRYPHYYLSAFNNFQVHKGIVLKNGFETITITVDPEKKSDRQMALDIQIRDSRNKHRVYYRTSVDILRDKPLPDRHVSLEIAEPAPYSLSVPELYEKQLFHGPLWHGIQQVETIGRDGIIGRLKTSRPHAYLHKTAASDDYDWLIDPLVIDSGLQLVVLWMRNQLNATPLPSRLNRFVRFDAPRNGDDLRCEVRVHAPADGGIKSADLYFLTPGGDLTGKMEGLEIIGDESLNRLAAQ
ncbi:MAG: SDR family NAD(P)-dependent oxidoreductase [Desulfosudaceae bacterium]